MQITETLSHTLHTLSPVERYFQSQWLTLSSAWVWCLLGSEVLSRDVHVFIQQEGKWFNPGHCVWGHMTSEYISLLRFWPLVMTRSGLSVIGLTLEVWMTEVWSIVCSSLCSVNSVWGLDNFASTVRLHTAGESGSSHHADRLTAPCSGAGELQGHSVSLYADLHSSLRPPQFSLLGETPFVLLQQADGLLTAALQRTNHSSAPDSR